MRFIEKENKDKRYIQYRRTDSLLNVNTKPLSKVLTERLEKKASFSPFR